MHHSRENCDTTEKHSGEYPTYLVIIRMCVNAYRLNLHMTIVRSFSYDLLFTTFVLALNNTWHIAFSLIYLKLAG